MLGPPLEGQIEESVVEGRFDLGREDTRGDPGGASGEVFAFQEQRPRPGQREVIGDRAADDAAADDHDVRGRRGGGPVGERND